MKVEAEDTWIFRYLVPCQEPFDGGMWHQDLQEDEPTHVLGSCGPICFFHAHAIA